MVDVSNRKREQEAEDDEEEAPHLTDYEMQRMQLIARNRARLLALGIPDAVQGLTSLAPSRAGAKGAVRKPKRAKGAEPGRRSARLQGGDEGGGTKTVGEVSQEQQELAMFIVDGECPRCGRVVSRGHQQHLDRCQGREEVQPLEFTEEELQAQAELMKKQENLKLRQLELQGLVDFTPDSAVFCVLGSHGSPYRVLLSDAGRKCQCVDHRVRKRDCKHIRLTLQSLGVEDNPQDWRQAVEARVRSTLGTEAASAGVVEAAEAAGGGDAGSEAGQDAPQGGSGCGAGAAGGSEQGVDEEAAGEGHGGAAPARKQRRGVGGSRRSGRGRGR